MDKIKKINEFFDNSEKDIQGLSEQEVSQLCDYAYAISSAFNSFKDNNVSLIKSVKEIQDKYKVVLDKLSSMQDIMSARKTKH